MEAIEIAARARKLVQDIDASGYARGLREGASRLSMLAALDPDSVTKAQLCKMAQGHARTLDLMATRAEGGAG